MSHVTMALLPLSFNDSEEKPAVLACTRRKHKQQDGRGRDKLVTVLVRTTEVQQTLSRTCSTRHKKR